MRRHSDRPSKRREYENIVYNNQGLPVILATHKGEKADEKMPFYQQEWLQRTLKYKEGNMGRNGQRNKPSVRASYSEASTDRSCRNDPLLLSLLKPPTKDQVRNTSLGFYEDKLINRDSGTDSPTYNSYDDHSVHDLIKTLDKEHAKLTDGEPAHAADLQKQPKAPASHYSTTYSPRIPLATGHYPRIPSANTISKVGLL